MLNDLHTIQLPHTGHCLVCGRQNPYGMKLDVFVVPENGLVFIEFTPRSYHVGYEGIVHGGLLTAVLDEAMTWAVSKGLKQKTSAPAGSDCRGSRPRSGSSTE